MVAEHGALLQGAPTDARISRLLWLRRTGDATKLLDGADSDTREIAKARLALIARPQRINEVMADVRSGLRSDSGLLFEQARASRLNGDIREAVPFALKAQGPAGSSASKWWAERQVLAREALQRGLYQEAYDVTAAHGLTSGPDYADAEWLAGWIALRFLDKPGRAAEHFTALFKAVSFPVSKARGAYWTGRAYEAAHHPADAATFYDTAASYETTYYGQLAQARLRQARATLALPPAGGRIADEPSFTKSELARATRLATATGSESVIRPFFMALGEAASTADEYRFAGNLANELGYPGLAVRIGKKALQDNIVLTDIAYPVLSVPKASDAPEAALVLGLTRQESEFDERAESPAGARGLMQLMPATAKHVAKQEHLRYDPAKLEDAGYNMRLGMAYLAGLIDRFNGSYPLAIASYNAGPTNTRRWMEDYGDPRDPNVDPVDWVEKIPFSETRNYVQRVLENTQVYRSRLAKGPVPVRIHEDLARPNAPKAFGDDLTAYLGRGSSTEVASAADVPVPEPVTSTPPAREASKVEPPKAAALADATPPAKPVEIASAAPTATAPMTASEPPLPAPPQALAPAPAAPPGKPSHILAPAPKPEPPAKSASKKEKAPAPKLAAKTKKKAPVDENEEAASAEQPVSTGRPTGTPFGNGQPETRDTPAKCARMILDLNGKTRCADRQALND
jgi:soluble lytic murein transglycosylase